MKPVGKFIRIATLVGAVFLFTAAVGASDWPVFQHDHRHSGVSDDAEIGVPMRVAWTFATNGPIRTQPVVQNGVAYFGSCDQQFYAVDVATGELVWRFFADAEVMSTAALGDDGNVYFGCDDGCVYALSAKTGELKWKSHARRDPPAAVPAEQFIDSEQPLVPPWPKDRPMSMSGFAKPTHQVVRAPLLVADGMVFAGAGRPGSWGYLHGFDAKTGQLQWTRPSSVQGTYRVFGGVENGPVMYRGILFWPEYMIEAIDPKSGKNIQGWPEPMLYRLGAGAFSFSSQVALSPEGMAVAYVYTRHYPHSGHPGRWYVIDLFDNSIRFVIPMGGSRPQLDQSPVISDGRVYVVQMQAKTAAHTAVGCYELLTGRWLSGFAEEKGKPFNGSLALCNGILFGVTEDGVVYALDARGSGPELRKLWTHELGTRVLASAAISNGKYLIGAEDGKMYAFTKDSDK